MLQYKKNRSTLRDGPIGLNIFVNEAKLPAHTQDISNMVLFSNEISLYLNVKYMI